MKAESYHRYLMTKNWKAIRTTVRRRSRGWCERCKVQRYDHIHHLTYDRVGHELKEDLIAVCMWCHEYLHGKSKEDPAAVIYTPEELKILRARVVLKEKKEYPGNDEFCTNMGITTGQLKELGQRRAVSL